MSRRATLLVGLLLGLLVGVVGFCWWVARDRTHTGSGRVERAGSALDALGPGTKRAAQGRDAGRTLPFHA